MRPLARARMRLAAFAARARGSLLVRATAGVGALNGAELLLGLLAAIVLARELGAEGFGTYSLALAAAVLAGLPVGAGVPRLVTREIAHLTSDSEHGVAKGVLLFAGAVIVLMSLVIVPLVLIFGEVLAPGLEQANRALIPLAALLIPVTATMNMLNGALAGRQRIVLGATAQGLVRPGLFALAVIAAAALSPGWLTPASAFALQIGGAAGGMTFAAVFFLREFAPALRAGKARMFWRMWAASTLRFSLAAALRLGQPQILVVLTGVLSSVENVALLRIAERGAGLVAVGTRTTEAAAAPRFARLNAQGQHARLQALILRVARMGAAVALAVSAGYLAFGHWLLDTLFGSEFTAAWSVLMILAGAESLRALFGPGAALMSMLRLEGVTAQALALSLALSVLVTVVLTPRFGAPGAAWGMFFGTGLMAVWLAREARRRLALDPSALGRGVARTRRGGSG